MEWRKSDPRGRIYNVFPSLSLGKRLDLEAHTLKGFLWGEPGIISQVLSELIVTRKIHTLHGDFKMCFLAFLCLMNLVHGNQKGFDLYQV